MCCYLEVHQEVFCTMCSAILHMIFQLYLLHESSTADSKYLQTYTASEQQASNHLYGIGISQTAY